MGFTFKQIVRDGMTGGASYDILEDDGKTIGQVDITAVPDGRREWEVRDGQGHKIDEGVFSADDVRSNSDLVREVWTK